ncbi:MAG: DUF523 domain-containing protein [Myxococcales bacterium]|nr:DUF523 domain-containing protein [Myxococcales bacterium]
MLHGTIDWERVRRATPEDPLRVLTSACLVGKPTGWEGTDYADDLVLRLVRLPNVRAVSFCPEHVGLGTPRPLTTLHDGDGFAVLDGKARVMDTTERDCTDALVQGARAMCDLAARERVELCVTLEVSDSCGTTFVYLGRPEEKRYQRGAGVSAAMLAREGFTVIAERDRRTLGKVIAMLDPSYVVPEDAIDVREIPWYGEYFGR